jgi:hypothetical protein
VLSHRAANFGHWRGGFKELKVFAKNLTKKTLKYKFCAYDHFMNALSYRGLKANVSSL